MKMMKKLLIIILFANFSLLFSQVNNCNLESTYFEDLKRVDVDAVKCLAKNSEKPNTLFLVFARWCEPCMWHLPTFMSIEKEYNVDLYVLLIDVENSQMTELSKDYVWERYPSAKVVVLKDFPKRGKGKKYKDFINAISPPEFEKLYDMSKYFVLDNKGDVVLVTSWKDSKGDPDWKDDRPMVKRLVLPLLQKKNGKLVNVQSLFSTIKTIKFNSKDP
jgi:thiol-disulfide isomerase/thioredoxin